MEFLNLTAHDDDRANAIYEAYCEAFPEDERRSRGQFNQLFYPDESFVIAVMHEQQHIGYLILWELSGFAFLEHFEVFPQFRNQNYGSKIIEELFKIHSRVVLETEPATLDETAKKRVDFYIRNCFQVIDDNYIQPAYDSEKQPIALWLMANFIPERPEIITEEIYDIVYK